MKKEREVDNPDNSQISQKKIKKVTEELKSNTITKQELLQNFLQEEARSEIFDEETIKNLEKITKHLKEIKKIKIKPKKTETKYIIPIALFSNRTLSTLEHVITYLKEHHNLTYQEISVLLNRNPRTVWTTYQRARKKRE